MDDAFRAGKLGDEHPALDHRPPPLTVDRSYMMRPDRNGVGAVCQRLRRLAGFPLDLVAQDDLAIDLPDLRYIDRRIGEDPGAGERVGMAVDFRCGPELGHASFEKRRRLA